MTKTQFQKITKWQKETFPLSNPLSKMEHLKEELDELKLDIQKGVFYRDMEYADCFILLFGMAESDGFTYEQICEAIDKKMELNYKRKWASPDEKGIVRHIHS